MVFWHAVESILTIIIMFMTGYFLTKAKVLDDKTSETFSKIILNISLPCYMIWNIMSNFTKSSLEKIAHGLVVPFLSIGLCFIFGVIVSMVFRVKRNRKGIFRSVFFTSNTIFIGLPVNLGLFGVKSVPYVLLYYIANTTLFWTIGAYEISRDGMKEGNKIALFSKVTLKRILSPALLGFIIAIILVMLSATLPSFVMSSCEYLGQLTTPLAMLFIGIILCQTDFRRIRIDRDVILLLIARFFICPMTIVLLTRFITLPALMTKVFIIQSAMPAMTSTGVVAKGYGADYEFAVVVTALTTVLSMIVIPIYMTLI